MQNEADLAWGALRPNFHLIVISIFGGLVLFGLKFTEHFMRPEQDKLQVQKYVIFLVGLFLALPFLGAGVRAIYLMNGDKLSPILALQVGLTSPAIVQSLVIAAANSNAKNSNRAVSSGQ
jgi:hypothetical protein